MSKWAGMWGPRWAAQITPTVFVWCPFNPRGTQSSFAPWLPSGTHAGHAVLVVFWYMGPMWAAPDLSHVGFWYMGPMWEAPELPHVGFWYMGPMWADPDLSHVGFWYMGPMTLWEAPDLPHVGFWHMGPMLQAPCLSHVGFWYMGRMWAAQIAHIAHIWCPFSPSGTQSSFAPWHPSGAHVGNNCIIP